MQEAAHIHVPMRHEIQSLKSCLSDRLMSFNLIRLQNTAAVSITIRQDFTNVESCHLMIILLFFMMIGM